jgi:DNA polymerase III epsilon subunit family exonuclease
VTGVPAKSRRLKDPAQLDLTTLLPRELEVDVSDRARKGIAIRLKEAPETADAPVRYSGIRVVNGRVIREGRHNESQWNYVGLAGAMPLRVYDYAPDVVLERRADFDGVVRLLPIEDSPGEPLQDMEYVVVDVETTGVGSARGHRITEVAIVHVDGNGHVRDEYTTLVNPERPIPRMITALTHISAAMVRKAPRFRDIALEVQKRLANRIFVAHNAGFDWGFLSFELQRTLGMPLRGRLLCTVRMARRLVPEMPRRSLDALCWHFGVGNEARHRAFGDARATAEVFGRIMERVRERRIGGWNELQQVLYARAPRRVRRSTPQFFDPLA